METYLRSFFLVLAVNSMTAFADSTDNIPMVSDIEMKVQQQEAMALIDQQIKRQLPVDMAKHYQLINQRLQSDKHSIKETVKNHSDNGKETRS